MEWSKVTALDGVGPVSFVKSRRARRVSVSVRASTGIRVTVPWRVSFETARQAAAGRVGWMRKTLGRIERARRANPDLVRAAAELDAAEARRRLAGRLAHLAATNGYAYRRLFIRRQNTLWGSCSTADNISLNVRLAALPPELADYVMLHELVHIRHRGHGPAFWAELGRSVPDARRLQARLRECGLAIL